MTTRSLLVLLLAACGDTSPAIDASAVPDGPVADALTIDAPPVDAAIDARAPDATVVDAAVPDAAGPDADICLDVGEPCSSGSCPRDLVCTWRGICVPPDHADCGGFTEAPCVDPFASFCLWYAGADTGICLSVAEAECVCATSPTLVTGCP